MKRAIDKASEQTRAGTLDLRKWPSSLAAGLVAVSIVAPERPQAKERPRFNPRTGAVYTPGKTRHHAEYLGWLAKRVWGGPADADSLFGVRILVAQPAAGWVDLDNVEKQILDAMTGVIWHDDRQVRETHCIGFEIEDIAHAQTRFLIHYLPDAVGENQKPRAETP